MKKRKLCLALFSVLFGLSFTTLASCQSDSSSDAPTPNDTTHQEEATLSSIAVTTPPTKTAYKEGDTFFTVTYGGKSATVNLEAPVEYSVTIDPNGGTIASEVLATYEDENNYQLSDDGTVFFSYATLDEPILLPTAEQMTRENYTFLN